MISDRIINGLVLCGGKSSRMGSDKSMLTYFVKPQRYHLYNMLNNICSRVYISCRSRTEDPDLPFIADLDCYAGIGPAAALLSAFTQFPGKSFLITGCDYPFLSESDLRDFLTKVRGNKPAAAFYIEKENIFEPLLGYYTYDCFSFLKEMFHEGQYSLQHFLRSVSAEKYVPADKIIMSGVNTPAEFVKAKEMINEQFVSR